MKNGHPRLETLQNGMRLVTVHMPGIQSLTVLAMVGVGSRFETQEKAGISHFLEHLPFKGTENYPTALDVSQAIDNVGGKHNAFTSKEYTGYWVKVAGTKAKLALDVVSDLLLTAKLRPDEIEREKGVIVEEINMYEDNPQFKVSNLFDAIVYQGSPLDRDVIGFKETVKAMTRKDFVEHWDQWYSPENVVVGLVGDLSEVSSQKLEAREVVEKYFNKGDKRPGGGEKVYQVPEQKSPRMEIFYKDTEQAHFHLGFPGVSRQDEERHAMKVLVTILGGNSSSWMFNEIREKRGLAYYAYASADLHHDVGSVYAFEGVSLDNIEDAIKVTMEQFERAVNGEITAEMVESAKEYVVGKAALDLEDSSSMTNLMVRKVLLENEVEPVEKMLDKVRAVTLEQVQAVARQVIDMKKLNLAVVGPYKHQEKFEKLIS